MLERIHLFMCELVPLSSANVKFIFWSCQIMKDLQAEEQSSKRQKTSCTSVSSPSNSDASSEASVSVQRPLSFSTTSVCLSPVTTTPTTTEGNVMQPIAGPSQTDDYSFQDTLSAPVHTLTPRPKCTRCVKHRKKRKALTKQHNRLKKRFIKLQEKFKLLQACEVIFIYSKFQFLKCMKYFY